MPDQFLPVTREEMLARGWDQPDFVVVSGDAYVDHPSFGHAIIARVLEDAGYRVCMLNQPDFHNARDFARFGWPKYGFMVAAGNIDSMVNHYTAAKRPRSQDLYSPGGRPGLRPDRATIVYCNRIHEAFGKIPIIIGGVEASLRRFAHYDYWDDSVRHSILADCGADLLSYGMAEKQTVLIADRLRDGLPLTGIPGIKPGLANIFTLFALCWLGRGWAFALMMVRVVLGCLITGRMTALGYSLAGGLLAFLVMAALLYVISERQLWVVSMFGAMAHNLGQMLVARFVAGVAAIWYYLPVLLLSALVTGLFTGLCAQLVLKRLRRGAGRKEKGEST